MMSCFNSMLSDKGIRKDFEKLLPKVLVAGEYAGELTEEGARLLDPTGNLKPGIILCPPEGDGETGMTATNCVAPKTANVSAGTSGFISRSALGTAETCCKATLSAVSPV